MKTATIKQASNPDYKGMWVVYYRIDGKLKDAQVFSTQEAAHAAARLFAK